MSLLGNRRRKKSRNYEILIIPQGGGVGTKSIKAGSGKLALWGGAVFAVLFLLFFLAFRFTPLGPLVGASSAGQGFVGNTDDETERRIRTLAEEIAVLKDYNVQLRKALGERAEKESSPQQKVENQKKEEQPQHQHQQSPAHEELASPTPATTQVVASAEGLKASFPLFTPVSGAVTQGFEPNQKHFGIDYAAKEGTPVYAAAHGYVVFSGWTYDDGNVLILSHGSGYITVYKHNSSLLKSTGSLVRRGELMSLVGSTGRTSKGPHLHFEVLKDGVPQDPQQFLLNSKTTL
ncbi:MAG: M23 family metallopeptidase [Bacteroidota bacterium]